MTDRPQMPEQPEQPEHAAPPARLATPAAAPAAPETAPDTARDTPPSPSQSPSPHGLARGLRWLLPTALALGGWTWGVGEALPGWLRPRIEQAAAQALGTEVRLETLTIAPWSLRLGIAGLRIGPADAPWLQLTEARTRLALLDSLWQRAPVIDGLSLQRPQLYLERAADGRLNIAPLLDRLARPADAPAAAPGEPPALVLQGLRLDGGSLRWVDRQHAGEHRIDALSLALPRLSTRPADANDTSPAEAQARLDGSTLRVDGQLRLFARPERQVAIDLDWRDLELAPLLRAAGPWLSHPLPLALDAGRAAARLQIRLSQPQTATATTTTTAAADRPARASTAPTGAGTAATVTAATAATSATAATTAAAPRPQPRLQISGELQIDGLRGQWQQGHGIPLAWQRLRIEALDLQPLQRQLTIGRVQLQGPDLTWALDAAPAATDPPREGGGAADATDTASTTDATGTPWRWHIAHIALDDGQLRLRHAAWPADRRLRALALQIDDLDSRPEHSARARLQARDDLDATLEAEATLQPLAGQASGRLALQGLDTRAWLAPWHARLPVDWQQGRLTLALHAAIDPQGWRLDEGSAQLDTLRLAPHRPTTGRTAPGRPPARGADHLALDRLSVDGVRIEQQVGQPLQARIGTVSLDGAALRASRGADGALPWLPPAAAGPRPAATGARAAATGTRPAATTAHPAAAPHRAATRPRPDAPAASPPPRWSIDTLRCRRCALSFDDAQTAGGQHWQARDLALTLRQLDSDARQPFTLQLASGFGRDGRLAVDGQVRRAPLQVRARLRTQDIDLSALQPWLDPYVNLSLHSARFDADGRLTLDGPASPAAAAAGTPPPAIAAAGWRGRLALRALQAQDRLNGADFLRWRTLALDGSALQWRPSSWEADLGRITLDGFYGRVIVNGDGRLNLRDIVRRSDEAERSLTTPQPQAAPASATEAAAAATAGPTRLRWQAIALTDGEADFTDLWIRPNYSARLTGLDGRVSALAWDDPQPATLHIGGKVDDSAPLAIDGTVHPLGPRLLTDLTASARGIDITRLSTYTARYAGYGIEQGTLSTTLHYRIEHGRLQADNRLYVDQLRFGDAVDSPDALNLPVRLAVALLQDRHGVIDVNLPVSGSLDDPQFSVGGLLVKVLVNLVTKAVTAPFTLLAQAFGDGQAELGHTPFLAGSDALDGDARALPALQTLAQALLERPQLKLEITGRADAATDGPALRRAGLEQQLREAKARALGGTPADVSLGPDERPRWLRQVWDRAPLPQRPSLLQRLREPPAAAAMEADLLALQTVDAAALRTLADRRADHVKAWLARQVPAERLLLTASRVETGPSVATAAATTTAAAAEAAEAAPGAGAASGAASAAASGPAATAAGQARDTVTPAAGTRGSGVDFELR
ncbi:MAG: hypothetical protein RIQ53_636 [Pseudomonadota bacterium]